MMAKCVRCLVAGRVQGVFYRASTQRQALMLDLTGWVRNLPDGRVEVVACGADEAVKALQDWLWDGPRHAEVTGVECATEAPPKTDSFEVR